MQSGIFEEAVQRDVRAAQVVDLAVQVGPLRGGIETKLAHAEPRADRIATGARLEHVQKRIFGRPEMGVGNRDGLRDDLRLAGAEGNGLRLGHRDLLTAFPGLDAVDQRRGDRRIAAILQLRSAR